MISNFKALTTITAIIAVILIAACSPDKVPTSIITPETPTSGDKILLLTSPYSLKSDTTMTVTTLSQFYCPDDSTPATAQSVEQTDFGNFKLVGDSLKLSLALVQGALIAFPGIGKGAKDTVELLADLSANYNIPIWAEFKSEDSIPAFQGKWAFVNLNLGAIYLILNPNQKKTVDDLVASVAGTPNNRVFFFHVGANSIRMSVSKNWYGETMIVDQVDTVKHDVSNAKINDTTWILIGDKSPDTITGTVYWQGDIIFTYSKLAPSFAPDTYYLHPTACPNSAIPNCMDNFLTANLR